MKQLKKNLSYNIVGLLTNVVVGVIYTPYIIRNLGIEAYALVPLALLINSYIAFLTSSLTSSLTRFYTVAVNQNDKQKASMYLSTSFFSITILCVFIILLALFLIANISSVFNIPEELLTSSRYLFAYTIIGFLCSLYSSVLNVTLYSKNKLDVLAIIKSVRIILKLVFVFLFFLFMEKKIQYIGMSILLTEFFVLIYSYYYYCKTVDDNVLIRFSYFSRFALISIMSMTVWVVMQSFGDILIYGVDIFFVNRVWGTFYSGILSGFNELNAYINGLVAAFSVILGPIILIAYSKQEHDKVKFISFDFSLYVGLLTAIISGICIGFSDYIISYWMGDQFIEYKIWLCVKLLVLPFHLAAGIFFFVIKAWNYLKIPALVTLALGSLNIIIVYSLTTYMHLEIISILYIIVTITLFDFFQSYILLFICYKKIYPSVRWRLFFKSLLRILLTTICSILISFLVTSISMQMNLYSVIISVMFTFMIIGLIVYLLILNNYHRLQLKSLILDFFK